MKSKQIKIFLVISFALNCALLFFIVRDFNRHEERIHPVERHMIKGDESQRPDKKTLKIIRPLLRASHIRHSMGKERLLEKRFEIMELMIDDTASEEDLEKKISELNEIENSLNRDFIRTIVNISLKLDPAERKKFIMHIGSKWFREGVPPQKRRRR